MMIVRIGFNSQSGVSTRAQISFVMATHDPAAIPFEQRGPAERLLDLVLTSGAHLWHSRPGEDRDGKWVPRAGAGGRQPTGGTVRPGLFVPAAKTLYRNLVEIYLLNADLMAHFGSYVLKETEWRDLKVACAALLLVQPLAGQAVRNANGEIEFYEDDYRAIGEAMLLYYEKGSKRMMNPKAVLRVAQLLETTEIAEINRVFAGPASKKPTLGRWKTAARRWLAVREESPYLLEGLVKAGFKETIKAISRKAGYKPQSERFFEILGWRQNQSPIGCRTVGIGDLKLQKRDRFDGLSEQTICERIVSEKLKFTEAVGRLPAEIGLTPAIMVALLPSLSDRDLRRLTPTLEVLDLLKDSQIRMRWESAIQSATDQRALNIVKNVKTKEVRDALATAADVAVQKAVDEATRDDNIYVMFLIDKSGSMERAIDQSKDALSKILAGFPPERLSIACFDERGTVLEAKAPTRLAVEHMLARIAAGGGTMHREGVYALYKKGVRFPAGSKLIVIVAGDEAGEDGRVFARSFYECTYVVSAISLILCVADPSSRQTVNSVRRSLVGSVLGLLSNPFSSNNFVQERGRTVRDCAKVLQVPYTEVSVDQFDDPYQVPRVLKTMLEAPVLGLKARVSWIDRIMQTPLLERPV